MKRDCMFQYGTNFIMIEDTGLISYEEAKELWMKYKPDFIRKHQDGSSEPEMCIWINCLDESDYRETVGHVTSSTIVEGNYFFEKTAVVLPVEQPHEQ